MSISLKCNICHHDFTVRKFESNQTCPVCGSTNVFKKSGEYLVSTPLLKKLILTEIILIIIIVSAILLFNVEGPRISKVETNKEDHLINVTVKASLLNRRLEYSFDNGKTYQNKNNFKVQQPGTYIIIVRDDKNKKNEWGIPVTFSDEDFDTYRTQSVAASSAPPPQITGVEPVNESLPGMNDGQIIIHTVDGEKPIRYSIDGGQSFSDDSIFGNLEDGSYTVYVVDNDSQIDTWPDPVILNQGVVETAEQTQSQPPSPNMVENLLNELFSDPENRTLRDSLQSYFVSQTMNVECELVDIPPNTPYQLFQFLQRRYEGQPGSKRIHVLEIGYDNMNRINLLRIRETRVLSNN
ncbi:MAG: hypothetical protein JXB49_09585 [Bacteroidales bacterium]|nr:hypothetical protein [Bacteroidales bacterium]